ncbi:mannose-6-phosphate isomerase, class I [Bacillus sp. SD088]|uniref:mannose-6-phosphate isomerase, class I n=1 Tax=Bacillus sp. SD088 TaxID=2782012 RepID=UPI001A962CE4|nr:mannose-6-phosphate isomerase, class I [Bacillus sp. SD088]MBO0994710.1 mannose-6-phosphate isomerase, class I [Bacillus sp. SD088]
MMEPLFLQPVFQERIWGGTALKTQFGYEIPSDHTGECWAISAHPNGPSIIKNGPFAGKTLIELWEEQPELFGNHPTKVFPLLTKILDANTDLSVQVHPDDEYANEHENGELGKTECWYIIDCKEGAELIYGHTAKTKEDFASMIEKDEWDQLLRRVKIKPGDFFYVPSGTIHALGEGTLVLETQQSSDTTYRLYDYGRIGQDGKTRELHIDQSIAVATIPHKNADVQEAISKVPGAEITTFVEAEYFTVYKWEVDGKATFEQDKPFMLVSVIDGEADMLVDGQFYPIQKGDHFILPDEVGDIEMDGEAKLIVSHV